jgi:hypothetical protein
MSTTLVQSDRQFEALVIADEISHAPCEVWNFPALGTQLIPSLNAMVAVDDDASLVDDNGY